jgi:NHL repeat
LAELIVNVICPKVIVTKNNFQHIRHRKFKLTARACQFLALIFIFLSCRREVTAPVLPPISVFPLDTTLNGYYLVTEHAKGSTVDSLPTYAFTFGGRIYRKDSITLSFIQTGRCPETYWTADFTAQNRNDYKDSLFCSGCFIYGQIVDDSTIRINYSYGLPWELYFVYQTWHRLRTGNDASLNVCPPDTATHMIISLTGMNNHSSPAADALITSQHLAMDSSGNIYTAESLGNVVRKISPDGNISVFAGNGTEGYSGDGGPANQAQIFIPSCIAIDKTGDVYIGDEGNHVIRKVSHTDGIITTIAGNNIFGYSGDGGPATQAEIGGIRSIVTDPQGNIYFGDGGFYVIRKISNTGIITTIAGNGTSGNSGDGGPATQASVYLPIDLCFDKKGNLYIADQYNNSIRVVDTTGVINTYAGGLISGFDGDGGPVAQAKFDTPSGIAFDDAGNFYISDQRNNRIRKVSLNGIISTYAGSDRTNKYGYGPRTYLGDYGPATKAVLSIPGGITLDKSGDLYIMESGRVRKVFH